MKTRKNLKKIQYINAVFILIMLACSTENVPADFENEDNMGDKEVAEALQSLNKTDDVLAAKMAEIEKRLEINQSNFKISNSRVLSGGLSNEPDVIGLINGIEFVNQNAVRTQLAEIGTKDVMINPDNEKGETAIMLFSDSGLFSIDNRVIPTPRKYQEGRAMAEKDAEDNMILQDVAKRMQSLGVKNKQEYEVVLGSVVATQSDDNGKLTQQEYERVARVYRKYNGIRATNKIVFSYDVDLNLRKVKGKWNKIDVEKSRLSTTDSPETIKNKVLKELAARNVDPNFERAISVNPIYVIEKDKYGDFVMNLKMAARVPVSNGVDGQASGIIMTIEI